MKRAVYGLAGLVFIAGFFGLTQTETGIEVSWTVPFTKFKPGELHFWIATTFLLLPGGMLLGHATSPWLVRALASPCARLGELAPKDARAFHVIALSIGFVAPMGILAL